MIDQIVELILKEARTRTSKDLVANIHTVYSEVSGRILQTMDRLREEERRGKNNEDKRRDLHPT